jgi:PPOX class probable F420-dependent enzyme
MESFFSFNLEIKRYVKEKPMTETIPTDYLDLFKKPSMAHLATLMPDGSPQVSPVWVDFDGKHVLINSVANRQKDKNMRRDGRVAVEIQDPASPFRYVLVRGIVVEITEDGAEEHIDTMAVRYTGEKYKWRVPGQVRVLYKIIPINITTSES